MNTITERAKKEILESIDQEPGKRATVFIKGPGCGGPSLGIEMRDALQGDALVQVDGIDLFIRKNAQQYFENTEIDFIDTYWGNRITVRRTDGCGKRACS